MRVLFTSSEAVPFAKTGGLADVSGSLPRALARLGHEVHLIIPAHRATLAGAIPFESLGIDFIVPLGNKTVTGHLLKSRLPDDSGMNVYLVQQDQYFDRDFLYTDHGKDYTDNCERFVFFSRAVMEAIRLLDLHVDIIHANDWQTGLVPAYLDIEYRNLPRYRDMASVFTIHNLAYQGIFWHWDMLLTGLDWGYFNFRQMEYYGKLNLLKTGIAFADTVSTVSPRYALEIQSEAFGCGLDALLRHRGSALRGILNGVDYEQWHPKNDSHITMNFDVDSSIEGKMACKAAIQEQVGLPKDPDAPLIGMIGRLAHQKGYDLMLDVLPKWCENTNMQWVILGTGEVNIEDQVKKLAERYPDKIAARIEFSDELAHRIEAGADMFLMPSRFEPCGLNQQYSLLYGTVPIVRETGGLVDTVIDVNAETLASGTANGFRFQKASPAALDETLERAYAAFQDKDQWNAIVRNGMNGERSWEHSAKDYVEMYEQTLAARQSGQEG